MVYRRKGRKAWFTSVPTRTGRVKRSTGTAHKATAKAIERMLVELGPEQKRDWELLDRVADGSLALGRLFDAWSMNALDRLREELKDVDLEPHVAIWQERIAGNVAPDTADHYRYYVRTLIPEGKPFWRSEFTADRLDAWLAAYPGARNTRRKARAGMSQFCAYLVRAKVLKHNPVRDVKAPPLGPPRLRYLDTREMLRLANSQAEDLGVLSALLGGSGIEVSAALRLTRRDVDTERREIRAAGTKTHSRDRIVRVAEWAWPYVRDHVDPLRPGDLLFPGITADQAGDSHRAACKRLGITDYRLHDQRHSYAVRAARAGTPAELIARQLGHANAIMVLRIYGRFMPSQQERDKWELIAAAQDQESALRGTSQGTSPPLGSGGFAANLSSDKGLQAPVQTGEPDVRGTSHAQSNGAIETGVRIVLCLTARDPAAWAARTNTALNARPSAQTTPRTYFRAERFLW